MAKAKLAKVYEPHEVERRWYQCWESEGHFRLPPDSERPGASVYCIAIPPPNVTGSLHIGHALQHSIHDAVARWRRLCGDRVLVVPGTDHAAISTNMKVEQALAEEGVSRHDIGRDAFVERCWEWTRRYGGEIIEQLKALGCSYDWDRLRFTLDDEYYRAVLEAFVRFYQRGWVYRGLRVVNWCPTCASTVSDLEVAHQDHNGRLWHIRYPLADGDGGIVVATTRPETMLGDTAVAVHSDDPRYRHLHGRQVMLPLMNRALPVICDDVLVDPEFGTGAVKVTPAHDLNDFEAGQRNGLPAVVVIGPDGRMTAEAGGYAGLDRYEARERIIADLEQQGLLVKTEEYVYPVGRHDKCDTVLEPLLSEQWFLRMEELARLARRAIEGDHPEVGYIPERFTRHTLDWLDSLRDWNISRQIWWGHRIPVYTCGSCGGLTVQVEAPTSCGKCGGEVEQDPDTLDTWFSSALWPFAVLGWPEESELASAREEGVFPTALMITARDILYLWIVRMIMTSLDFTGKIPFRHVLVHPTVLNLEGRRMSKSLGTGVDPLELISRYGSDATRFSLLYQCGSEQDIRFGEERTEMARNFCNKIWNASRFVLMNLGEEFAPVDDTPARIKAEGSLAERWALSRYGAMLSALDSAMGRFEMAEAARTLYSFFWSEFCDWFVELCKPALRTGGTQADRARQTLWFVLEGTLRALHPLMPFITEEVWQQLTGRGKALIDARWPQGEAGWQDAAAEREMEAVMQVVVAARKLRADQKLPPGQQVNIGVAAASQEARRIVEANREGILLLARGRDLTLSDKVEKRPAMSEAAHVCGEPASIWIATEASREELQSQEVRLRRDLSRLQEEEAHLSKKLQDPNFRSRAPASVVSKTETRQDEIGRRRDAIEGQLAVIAQMLSGGTLGDGDQTS
jgi:valyl-tRNA synthetase